MWARIDWTRTGLDFVDEAKDQHQADLARLNAVYGDDWVDGWPMDNSDADVVVTRKGMEFDIQRAVVVRGVKVGWVSRTGGYGDKPVSWEAYLRNPGEVKGIGVQNDPSKLRYAVIGLLQATAQEAARAARYLLQDHGCRVRQEVAR